MASELPPILTAHLFPPLERLLSELLASLSENEWEAQTIAPQWKVKDVAAHLLDTQLRKLSLVRDGYAREKPAIGSPAEFVAFINRLNREGVGVYGRLSPAVLISLLEFSARAAAQHQFTLHPFAPAMFAVSWAGESESLNWFDTARELTERWHHQQQIREAVGRPGIMTRELYHPVLDCFMRGLPYRYQSLPAPQGSLLRFDISGDCGGTWWLQRRPDGWNLLANPGAEPLSQTTIPQEIAWRIFTKGINPAEAEKRVTVAGARELGCHILGMTAIVG